MASALACGVFAAVTAGNLEATLAMSKIAFPEMKKYKYADSLAAGSIAAGGTIGSLIPPSVAFIIYGLLTETSVGKLFMAGIIPGIIEIVSYIIVIYLICLYNPKMAEIVPKVVFKEKLVSLKAILPMLCLFLFIFGGIYGGIFTPTEAAALGALGAIIITVAWRKLKRENLLSSLKEALTITAAILMIMIGAYIFMRFMTVSQLPAQLGKYIVSFNLSHVLTMLLIAVFYLVAGCFLNTIAIMLLTVPIIYPLVQALGYDLIWFGVIMVRLMEIGMISPPIGINVFITSKATGLPVSTVYKGILPFVLADILNVVLLIAIPQISLFLPNLM